MLKNIKKTNILLYIIIALGMLLRLVFITRFPAGLNCDEASAAYEAYSILNTLHDRNNYLLPVYLVSWGSGQNALLTYLTIPFVKLLGLNILATRLPMAIISSISVFIFYKLILLLNDNDIDNNYIYILFAVLFFVLNPWHIMKSRWALESNLLPDFVLFGTYFIIKFVKTKKERFLYIGFVLFAISAYAYSTSFLALTLFTLIFFVYCIVRKCVNIRMIICTAAIVLLITWPLILFVIINVFDLEEINLTFLSIPKLRVNRLFGESVGNTTNILVSIFQNFINEIKFIILQDDGIYWNGIRGIGIYYLFSFPFLVVGIFEYINDKINKHLTEGKDIMFIWLISGFIMCLFLKDININRANYMIIPLIYFVIKGFKVFFSVKHIKLIPFIVLIINFIVFSYKYIDFNIKKEKGILINKYNTSQIDCFVYGFDKLIPYLNSNVEFSNIHLGGIVNEPHIYVLYYTKYNPRKFIVERELISKNRSFNNIKKFGKWNFEISNYLLKDEHAVYVFNPSIRHLIDETSFNITELNNYIIVNYKGD